MSELYQAVKASNLKKGDRVKEPSQIELDSWVIRYRYAEDGCVWLNDDVGPVGALCVSADTLFLRVVKMPDSKPLPLLDDMKFQR